jgi:hypothetical protein
VKKWGPAWEEVGELEWEVIWESELAELLELVLVDPWKPDPVVSWEVASVRVPVPASGEVEELEWAELWELV